MNQEAQLDRTAKKKTKPSTESLRVKRETKKKILGELIQINRKDFGRVITPDQFISLAISLIQPEHIHSLKEQSLTAKDRFEQRYLEYCKTHGKISKDEFLATLLK